jgi:hypothetical protein
MFAFTIYLNIGITTEVFVVILGRSEAMMLKPRQLLSKSSIHRPSAIVQFDVAQSERNFTRAK